MCEPYIELRSELDAELLRILNYWVLNTLDEANGGFSGMIDHYNQIIPNASKGIILNSRILWAFSAASNHLKTQKYTSICHRAFDYIKNHFYDTRHKGVFWEVDHKGNPINKRKQVYAQAFCIYAFSEYYIHSQNEEAKRLAIEIFDCIEKYSKDDEKGGYMEAFGEDWSTLDDVRLSTKDMNADKTMNTHLHILEAYTTLLKIHKSKKVRDSLHHLVNIFQNNFLNKKNHYELFFDRDWNLLSNTVSYGHDIESAWLVLEAAKCIPDKDLQTACETSVIKVADTFLNEAIDAEGAVMNEKNMDTGSLDDDRHWWPQVEAMVGMKYAHMLTGNNRYLEKSIGIWKFTKKHLIDCQNGEWHFRVDRNGNAYTEEYKVSMWKAPYHTTRACIILASAT
ncbi:AGE family epimerase/isomerase [Fulvivirga sp. 29W222]|uniref:Cellobiose 2-epimerase n=1 Tax=Fulvivirga marina TaxID=2494733 RepID=A0A937FXI5_9BACT|nr:AGE family epimerase/isomerase [Fulvivirga marina]MBL6447939.1 AGE family epimerase/isomerase [Fulvivirga marina]